MANASWKENMIEKLYIGRCDYASVSLCSFNLSDVYMGESSIVDGAVGMLFSMCSLWLSSSSISPKHIMFMFWPSKCNKKKSPTCEHKIWKFLYRVILLNVMFLAIGGAFWRDNKFCGLYEFIGFSNYQDIT